MRYLAYLQYWKEPRYAQYIVYPHALYFLDRLQSPEFRRSLLNEQTANFIHEQQFLHWKYGHQLQAQQAATPAAADANAASAASAAGANIPREQAQAAQQQQQQQQGLAGN